MPATVDVTVEKSGVDARLKAYGTVIRDFSPFLRDELRRMREATRRRFETEGGDVGGWAKLSPRYAAWKAARYPGAPILVATGEMRRSLVDGGTGAVEEVTARSLTYGTTVPYARFHQFGTRRMPARRILALSDAETAGMGERLMRYIRTQTEAS